MTEIKPLCGGTVEADPRDMGIGLKKIDKIIGLYGRGNNISIQTTWTATGFQYIPNGNTVACERFATYLVGQFMLDTDDRFNERPEYIARMSVVLTRSERCLAWHGA